jgi:hypothetical protein
MEKHTKKFNTDRHKFATLTTKKKKERNCFTILDKFEIDEV